MTPYPTDGGDTILCVCPLMSIIFTNLQLSTTQTILLAQKIPASHAQEVNLILRLHAGTTITTPASQSLAFNLLGDAATPEDPTASFTAVLNSYTTPGTALTYPFAKIFGLNLSSTVPFGRHLAVNLVATQSNPAAALVATFSIDLIYKNVTGVHVPGPREFRGYSSH